MTMHLGSLVGSVLPSPLDDSSGVSGQRLVSVRSATLSTQKGRDGHAEAIQLRRGASGPRGTHRQGRAVLRLRHHLVMPLTETSHEPPGDRRGGESPVAPVVHGAGPALRCAYCHGPLSDPVDATVCDDCGAVLHSKCRTENRGCTTRGCVKAMTSAAGSKVIGDSPKSTSGRQKSVLGSRRLRARFEPQPWGLRRSLLTILVLTALALAVLVRIPRGSTVSRSTAMWFEPKSDLYVHTFGVPLACMERQTFVNRDSGTYEHISVMPSPPEDVYFLFFVGETLVLAAPFAANFTLVFLVVSIAVVVRNTKVATRAAARGQPASETGDKAPR